MRSRRTINTAAAALWASALLIAALVIVQAGRLPVNPAYAEMGIDHGGFTIATVNSGHGAEDDPDELLYVIDNRDEVLLLYEIEDARQKQILLRGGGSLRGLFVNARR